MIEVKERKPIKFELHSLKSNLDLLMHRTADAHKRLTEIYNELIGSEKINNELLEDLEVLLKEVDSDAVSLIEFGYEHTENYAVQFTVDQHLQVVNILIYNIRALILHFSDKEIF